MADYSITEMLSFLYPYFLASFPSPIIKKKKEEGKCVLAVIFSFDAFGYKTFPLISGHPFLTRHLLPCLLCLNWSWCLWMTSAVEENGLKAADRNSIS